MSTYQHFSYQPCVCQRKEAQTYALTDLLTKSKIGLSNYPKHLEARALELHRKMPPHKPFQEYKTTHQSEGELPTLI